MKKKENRIKNLIWIIALISIITQINIFLDYGILKSIEKRKNEQLLKCPPDICTIDKKDIKYPIEFEIIGDLQ